MGKETDGKNPKNGRKSVGNVLSSWTVNKRLEIEKADGTVDFESISRKLEALTESGQLKRRKKAADLLDKMRPALMKARENKVPLRTLTAFLKDSGIPVSKTTLQTYLSTLPNAKKTRKRRVKKVAPKREPTAPAEATKKKLPPRLARRANP